MERYASLEYVSKLEISSGGKVTVNETAEDDEDESSMSSGTK